MSDNVWWNEADKNEFWTALTDTEKSIVRNMARSGVEKVPPPPPFDAKEVMPVVLTVVCVAAASSLCTYTLRSIVMTPFVWMTRLFRRVSRIAGVTAVAGMAWWLWQRSLEDKTIPHVVLAVFATSVVSGYDATSTACVWLAAALCAGAALHGPQRDVPVSALAGALAVLGVMYARELVPRSRTKNADPLGSGGDEWTPFAVTQTKRVLWDANKSRQSLTPLHWQTHRGRTDAYYGCGAVCVALFSSALAYGVAENDAKFYAAGALLMMLVADYVRGSPVRETMSQDRASLEFRKTDGGRDVNRQLTSAFYDELRKQRAFAAQASTAAAAHQEVLGMLCELNARDDYAAMALQYMLDYGGMPPDTQPESGLDAKASRQLMEKRRSEMVDACVLAYAESFDEDDLLVKFTEEFERHGRAHWMQEVVGKGLAMLMSTAQGAAFICTNVHEARSRKLEPLTAEGVWDNKALDRAAETGKSIADASSAADAMRRRLNWESSRTDRLGIHAARDLAAAQTAWFQIPDHAPIRHVTPDMYGSAPLAVPTTFENVGRPESFRSLLVPMVTQDVGHSLSDLSEETFKALKRAWFRAILATCVVAPKPYRCRAIMFVNRQYLRLFSPPAPTGADEAFVDADRRLNYQAGEPLFAKWDDQTVATDKDVESLLREAGVIVRAPPLSLVIAELKECGVMLDRDLLHMSNLRCRFS